jgi:hypothetical protein
MREAALDLVLPTHQVAARKLGNERVSRAALGAVALGESGLSVPAAADGLLAFGVAAEPTPLRHLRVRQDCPGGIALGYARYRDDPGAEAAAGARRPR